MPRNLFTLPAAVPMNVPWSSVTVGLVESAKTVAVAAQMIISDARRKAMTASEKREELTKSKGELWAASYEGM